jgi:hypothetical protein
MFQPTRYRPAIVGVFIAASACILARDTLPEAWSATSSTPEADFNGDGVLDCSDIDLLVTEIAAGTNASRFDLNSDGLVDASDLEIWLALAGTENTSSGNPYLPADVNLDGFVDGVDFIAWNASKFSATGTWCGGADLNADGVTDGQDFIIWNQNKFQSSR